MLFFYNKVWLICPLAKLSLLPLDVLLTYVQLTSSYPETIYWCFTIITSKVLWNLQLYKCLWYSVKTSYVKILDICLASILPGIWIKMWCDWLGQGRDYEKLFWLIVPNDDELNDRIVRYAFALSSPFEHVFLLQRKKIIVLCWARRQHHMGIEHLPLVLPALG